ncbi:MAG TPA: hypothetical protein PKB10_08885, partial [Tepidisphaeraceae bacterium]|nr:hypothetical protein [Tepidisphaeraceae bacterium]
PQAYKSAYHDLLLRTRDALPTVRLILCEPFLLPVGIITPSDVDHLRARATMVRELAETFGALFVPLQDRFDQASQEAPADHWLFDGIHPHAPGQWVIARAWLNAINGGGTPDNHPEMK